jgi:uncharacterized protein YbjT (DUF2867 family)
LTPPSTPTPLPFSTAIILGASGSVGQALVDEVVRSGRFGPVILLARRPGATGPGEGTQAGVVEHLVPDMRPQALEQAVVDALAGCAGPSVGFSVLGVGAGTAALTIDQHRAVDVELNAAFARGLKRSDEVQQLVFMSAVGADPQARTTGSGAAGMPRYARVKGVALALQPPASSAVYHNAEMRALAPA